MSKTFTDKLKKNYEEACKKNMGQDEFYVCATSGGTTKRILNLDSQFVFCEEKQGVEKEKSNEIKEYRLQAFMIKAALKETNHMLPIKDKEWFLLDAERTFVEDDLSEVGSGKRLDILAYEKATQTYVVLELKIKRDFAIADKELLRYTSTIEKHIDKANEIYSVAAKNVQGYIVWPSNENPRKSNNHWGLIEYDEDFLANIENVKLKVVKNPK